jgi:hypothetical protein
MYVNKIHDFLGSSFKMRSCHTLKSYNTWKFYFLLWGSLRINEMQMSPLLQIRIHTPFDQNLYPS